MWVWCVSGGGGGVLSSMSQYSKALFILDLGAFC